MPVNPFRESMPPPHQRVTISLWVFYHIGIPGNLASLASHRARPSHCPIGSNHGKSIFDTQHKFWLVSLLDLPFPLPVACRGK